MKKVDRFIAFLTVALVSVTMSSTASGEQFEFESDLSVANFTTYSILLADDQYRSIVNRLWIGSMVNRGTWRFQDRFRITLSLGAVVWQAPVEIGARGWQAGDWSGNLSQPHFEFGVQRSRNNTHVDVGIGVVIPAFSRSLFDPYALVWSSHNDIARFTRGGWNSWLLTFFGHPGVTLTSRLSKDLDPQLAMIVEAGGGVSEYRSAPVDLWAIKGQAALGLELQPTERFQVSARGQFVIERHQVDEETQHRGSPFQPDQQHVSIQAAAHYQLGALTYSLGFLQVLRSRRLTRVYLGFVENTKPAVQLGVTAQF